MAPALPPSGRAPERPVEVIVDENEHPKGALLFMLVYLVTLSALWLNAYMRLWR